MKSLFNEIREKAKKTTNAKEKEMMHRLMMRVFMFHAGNIIFHKDFINNHFKEIKERKGAVRINFMEHWLTTEKDDEMLKVIMRVIKQHFK